uniref:C-type lectin domain-containing protein n=1 Tax=Neogobius melanostomus TaxID=47308 RepID=A0A8C6UGR1_9GOBI
MSLQHILPFISVVVPLPKDRHDSNLILLLLELVVTVTAGKYVYVRFRLNWFEPTLGLSFLCYKVHAIRTRMTWDEALQYCRTHHHDLASVASETEMMLIEKELRKELSSLDVWVGFLAEDWLWVDGQPLEYEAWGLEGKPWCPMLQHVTQWNARQCDDELHFLCY